MILEVKHFGIALRRAPRVEQDQIGRHGYLCLRKEETPGLPRMLHRSRYDFLTLEFEGTNSSPTSLDVDYRVFPW